MAKMSMTISGFDDVDKLFENLGDTKKIRMAAVDKAVPTLVNSAGNAVRSVVSKDATGALARSFAADDAKENEYGAFTVVKPVGSNAKGVRYGEIAAHLEFGTPRAAARPWRQKAINGAKAKCESIMEESVLADLDKL